MNHMAAIKLRVGNNENSEAPRGKPRGNLLRRSSIGYAGRVFARLGGASGEAWAEPCEAKNAIHPCGKPLIQFLAERLGVSRNKAKEIIDQRRVFVNGRRIWMAPTALNNRLKKLPATVNWPPANELMGTI